MRHSAILRDGSVISEGDEVQTDFYKACAGLTFVVEQVTPHETCESGFLVVAALKEDRSKKLLGFKKEGLTFKDGLDANHFRKITADPGAKPAEAPSKEEKGNKKSGKKGD